MFSWLLQNNKVNTDKEKVEEILSRGTDEVIFEDELRKKLLSGKRLRVKLGIDPTSPNLHLGRAVPLMKLRDFQRLGHQIVLIIGDGTGVIGDTSDKDSERPMLTKEKIKENMREYFKQAGMILDMSRVEKRYNSLWLHKLTYEEIGEHANQFSVADFIARDNIRRRLDEGKRVSLREVLYPLMQGYDSVAVRADVELGGVDQRFNLLAGRTLQEHFGQKPQNILMTPLIEGTDGRKMSSSWGNTVNLTDSPKEMYAKIMKVNDEVIPTYLYNLTRIPKKEVEELIQDLQSKTKNPKDIKMLLAYEIVADIYTKKDADNAQDAFVSVFQERKLPSDIKKVSAKEGDLLVDILLQEKIVQSKTDFRRLVDAHTVVNKTTQNTVSDDKAVAEKGIYKIGKHRFIEIQ